MFSISSFSFCSSIVFFILFSFISEVSCNSLTFFNTVNMNSLSSNLWISISGWLLKIYFIPLLWHVFLILHISWIIVLASMHLKNLCLLPVSQSSVSCRRMAAPFPFSLSVPGNSPHFAGTSVLGMRWERDWLHGGIHWNTGNKAHFVSLLPSWKQKQKQKQKNLILCLFPV